MIEVVIDDHDIFNAATPALWENHVVIKLREAGIPVKGILVFGGVLSGTLVKQHSNITNQTIYRWQE